MEIVDQVLESARKLISLAEEGDATCDDEGFHVFFGVVRDCAYKILTDAEHKMDIY